MDPISPELGVVGRGDAGRDLSSLRGVYALCETEGRANDESEDVGVFSVSRCAESDSEMRSSVKGMSWDLEVTLGGSDLMDDAGDVGSVFYGTLFSSCTHVRC